ncbi:hypothetical protein Hanom_Chr05g00434811 [Helianthus anomalus]
MFEPTPYKETKCGEEHHSRPVVLVIDKTFGIDKTTRLGQRKEKRTDRNRKRIEGRCKMEKKKTLQFTHDQSFLYIPCIRFLPGEFKF